MKKFAIVLSSLLLMLGIGACQGNQPTGKPTNLSLSPTEVTLKVGETKQLTATVEPKDQTFTVTFTSDNPSVATVDEAGLVKAVAQGTATITVKVADKSATASITVIEDVKQEMPLLKFDVQFDDQKHVITDAELLAYEAALGRKYPVSISLDASTFEGFVNKDLTITAVIYNLMKDEDDVIVAYSTETLAHHEKTKAMLAELGFTTFETVEFSDGSTGIRSFNNTDRTIFVTMYDHDNPPVNGKLFIEFKKDNPRPTIDTDHEIIPTVKDFPSIEKLKNGDEIKSFEENLGFRQFNAAVSADGGYWFDTKSDQVANSNLSLVYYVSNDPAFIVVKLNCISDVLDLFDERMMDYVKANGFGAKIVGNPETGIKAYDEKGNCFSASVAKDENGKLTCSATITPATGQSKATMQSSWTDLTIKSLRKSFGKQLYRVKSL